jgi:hypothetical protein
MPKESEVSNKFLSILKRTDFNQKIQEELISLPAAIKWNLI